MAVAVPGSVGPSRASSPTLELSTNPKSILHQLGTNTALSPQPYLQDDPISSTLVPSVTTESDVVSPVIGDRPLSLSPPPSSDPSNSSQHNTSHSPARHPLIRSVTEPLDGQVQQLNDSVGTTGRKAAPTRSVTAAPNGPSRPSQPTISPGVYELEKPQTGTLNAAQTLRLVTAKAETPEGSKEAHSSLLKPATSQAPLVLDKFSLHETRSVSQTQTLQWTLIQLNGELKHRDYRGCTLSERIRPTSDIKFSRLIAIRRRSNVTILSRPPLASTSSITRECIPPLRLTNYSGRGMPSE